MRRKIIAEIAAELRLKEGLKQKDLARKLRLSGSIVSAVENPNSSQKYHDTSTISSYAEYFKVAVQDISEKMAPYIKNCYSCGVEVETYSQAKVICDVCKAKKQKAQQERSVQRARERREQQRSMPTTSSKPRIIPDYSANEGWGAYIET